MQAPASGLSPALRVLGLEHFTLTRYGWKCFQPDPSPSVLPSDATRDIQGFEGHTSPTRQTVLRSGGHPTGSTRET